MWPAKETRQGASHPCFVELRGIRFGVLERVEMRGDDGPSSEITLRARAAAAPWKKGRACGREYGHVHPDVRERVCESVAEKEDA